MAPSESQTQKLISLYRSCECLWNPQSPGYHSSSVQDDAWRKITRGMNSGLTPDQVKLRVLALRNYYDKECAAIRRNQQKGYSYVPRHSYFKDLLFLGDMQYGETEESKASFCMGQLNCILEDSFILSENNSIKADYPLNYSGATFCQYTASLGNRSNESKPGYTLYKLILEPEKPTTSREKENGKLLGNSNERSTSGNDRWYPTTYCVRCDKATCSGRVQSRASESRSCSSMDHSGACCPNRDQDEESCSCSSETESEPSCMDSQRQRTSRRTHNDSDSCGCSQNRASCDNWPGPKLCGQTRPKAACKCRAKKELGRDKSCCVDNWRRNNDAVCQRLQAQLARQNEEAACSRKPRTTGRSCSGEDQMNVMLLKNNCPRNGNPQSINCQAPNQQMPDAGRYSQPGPDPGHYNNSQQMQDSTPYINNQPIPDPGRYANDQQDQQIYQDVECPCYPMPARPLGYYQPQQYAQSPTNYAYSGQPSNSMGPGQQYVEAEYVPCQLVNDYGRPAYPEQPNVYCYAPDKPNNWAQMQSRAPAPMMPPSPSCDFKDSRPNCKAPCASSGPTDLDNRYPADCRRYPEQQPNARRRQEDDDIAGYPADEPRERPTRRRYKYQDRYTDDELETQRRRNDFFPDQRRQYREDDREDSVARTRNFNRRGREYDDDSPTRRRHRNEDLDRRKCCDDQYCPLNDYQEGPAGGRQRTAENPDSYYENPYSQREKRNLKTQTPRRTDQTIFSKNPPPEKRKKRRKEEAPLESESQEKIANWNESKQMECPAYDRQNPKECPNLTYKRQQNQGREDRSRQDREERIARKTRPPSRNREYEDDENPSARSRGGPPPEEYDSEDEKISRRKDRSKNGPNGESNKPKRRDDDNYCNDEICNLKDRLGRKNRQDRDVESGNGKNKSLKREVMETFCTDYTCPYIGNSTSDLGAVPNDGSRKRPPKDLNESTKKKRRDRYDDEKEEKSSSTKKRTSDATKDNERHRNGKSKQKDVDDCECYSDDNNYDQRRNRRDDRYYDEEPDERSPREKLSKYPQGDDRNESYRYNGRSQRGYPRDDDYDGYDYTANRGNKNMIECVDDCVCSIDTYDTMRETSNRNYRGREKSPRNRQKNKDYEESDYERNTRRTGSPKRNGDKVAAKKESKSRETDVYESEHDCPCSGDELNPKEDRNPPPSRGPRRGRNDEREPKSDKKKDNNQERSRENKTDVDSVITNTSTQNRNPRKYRNDQNDLEAGTKDAIQERADIDDCDCDKDGNEYSKKPSKAPATKSDPVQDDCNCEPLSAPFEQQAKRNPAGNGSFPLNEPLGIPFKDLVEMEPTLKPPSKTNSDNKPFEASNKLKPEEPKVVNETGSNAAEQAPPSKKKNTGPGPSRNGKSSKLKSRSASPTRSSVPKTLAAEPVKRRAAPRTGALSSPIERRSGQSGAKRTTDTSAAANSKLPFDLNSASYFICKLQDAGNTHQYFVVVPKEPTGRSGRHREDPGQGSVKQLHCRRQCSGFQSVSWVNPASACQSRPLSELSSSVAPPSLTDTTLRIVKEYLQRSMMQGHPNLRDGIQPVVAPPQRLLKTVLSGPRRRKPVLRPSNKANAAILAENRTVLLTNNPFENLSLADNGGDVIVLHPPVPGFRPSKNSFNKDAVEVERITIRGSDTDVNPRPTPAAPLLPPRPPTKPKRK